MLFFEKYPDMKPIIEEKDNIIRAKEKGYCSVCGRPTEYVEINYEGYYCSDECVAMEGMGRDWCPLMKGQFTKKDERGW